MSQVQKGGGKVDCLRITAPFGRSAHGVLRFTIPDALGVPPPKLTRAYNKIDKPCMLEEARRLEWNVPYRSIEDVWQLFKEMLGRLSGESASHHLVYELGHQDTVNKKASVEAI
ncbi:unnamed protein product [Echinostoma caproni]|uniref:UBC core domain-containing protein n=1 Tax=Echinostoma caproni TaxID=27848 RepID=A0A183B2T0_9TREM|nr:unnamed protein product [Echinostoma caproni]